MELTALLDARRKFRRVPQNWMPVVDLVIFLACCITPWLVNLAVHFANLCEEMCDERMQAEHDAGALVNAAVYLTVAVG